ncbi:MAG: hypothetical protein JXR42_03670 [Gammaproteobacteria bacterium]|nr:hypothetical protein [Gammaproteobacteria bacterium]
MAGPVEVGGVDNVDFVATDGLVDVDNDPGEGGYGRSINVEKLFKTLLTDVSDVPVDDDDIEDTKYKDAVSYLNEYFLERLRSQSDKSDIFLANTSRELSAMIIKFANSGGFAKFIYRLSSIFSWKKRLAIKLKKVGVAAQRPALNDEAQSEELIEALDQGRLLVPMLLVTYALDSHYNSDRVFYRIRPTRQARVFAAARAKLQTLLDSGNLGLDESSKELGRALFSKLEGLDPSNLPDDIEFAVSDSTSQRIYVEDHAKILELFGEAIDELCDARPTYRIQFAQDADKLSSVIGTLKEKMSEGLDPRSTYLATALFTNLKRLDEGELPDSVEFRVFSDSDNTYADDRAKILALLGFDDVDEDSTLVSTIDNCSIDDFSVSVTYGESVSNISVESLYRHLNLIRRNSAADADRAGELVVEKFFAKVEEPQGEDLQAAEPVPPRALRVVYDHVRELVRAPLYSDDYLIGLSSNIAGLFSVDRDISADSFLAFALMSVLFDEDIYGAFIDRAKDVGGPMISLMAVMLDAAKQGDIYNYLLAKKAFEDLGPGVVSTVDRNKYLSLIERASLTHFYDLRENGGLAAISRVFVVDGGVDDRFPVKVSYEPSVDDQLATELSMDELVRLYLLEQQQEKIAVKIGGSNNIGEYAKSLLADPAKAIELIDSILNTIDNDDIFTDVYVNDLVGMVCESDTLHVDEFFAHLVSQDGAVANIDKVIRFIESRVDGDGGSKEKRVYRIAKAVQYAIDAQTNVSRLEGVEYHSDNDAKVLLGIFRNLGDNRAATITRFAEFFKQQANGFLVLQKTAKWLREGDYQLLLDLLTAIQVADVDEIEKQNLNEAFEFLDNKIDTNIDSIVDFLIDSECANIRYYGEITHVGSLFSKSVRYLGDNGKGYELGQLLGGGILAYDDTEGKVAELLLNSALEKPGDAGGLRIGSVDVGKVAIKRCDVVSVAMSGLEVDGDEIYGFLGSIYGEFERTLASSAISNSVKQPLLEEFIPYLAKQSGDLHIALLRKALKQYIELVLVSDNHMSDVFAVNPDLVRLVIVDLFTAKLLEMIDAVSHSFTGGAEGLLRVFQLIELCVDNAIEIDLDGYLNKLGSKEFIENLEEILMSDAFFNTDIIELVKTICKYMNGLEGDGAAKSRDKAEDLLYRVFEVYKSKSIVPSDAIEMLTAVRSLSAQGDEHEKNLLASILTNKNSFDVTEPNSVKLYLDHIREVHGSDAREYLRELVSQGSSMLKVRLYFESILEELNEQDKASEDFQLLLAEMVSALNAFSKAYRLDVDAEDLFRYFMSRLLTEGGTEGVGESLIDYTTYLKLIVAFEDGVSSPEAVFNRILEDYPLLKNYKVFGEGKDIGGGSKQVRKILVPLAKEIISKGLPEGGDGIDQKAFNNVVEAFYYSGIDLKYLLPEKKNHVYHYNTMISLQHALASALQKQDILLVEALVSVVSSQGYLYSVEDLFANGPFDIREEIGFAEINETLESMQDVDRLIDLFEVFLRNKFDVGSTKIIADKLAVLIDNLDDGEKDTAMRHFLGVIDDNIHPEDLGDKYLTEATSRKVFIAGYTQELRKLVLSGFESDFGFMHVRKVPIPYAEVFGAWFESHKDLAAEKFMLGLLNSNAEDATVVLQRFLDSNRFKVYFSYNGVSAIENFAHAICSILCESQELDLGQVKHLNAILTDNKSLKGYVVTAVKRRLAVESRLEAVSNAKKNISGLDAFDSSLTDFGSQTKEVFEAVSTYLDSDGDQLEADAYRGSSSDAELNALKGVFFRTNAAGNAYAKASKAQLQSVVERTFTSEEASVRKLAEFITEDGAIARFWGLCPYDENTADNLQTSFIRLSEFLHDVQRIDVRNKELPDVIAKWLQFNSADVSEVPFLKEMARRVSEEIAQKMSTLTGENAYTEKAAIFAKVAARDQADIKLDNGLIEAVDPLLARLLDSRGSIERVDVATLLDDFVSDTKSILSQILAGNDTQALLTDLKDKHAAVKVVYGSPIESIAGDSAIAKYEEAMRNIKLATLAIDTPPSGDDVLQKPDDVRIPDVTSELVGDQAISQLELALGVYTKKPRADVREVGVNPSDTVPPSGEQQGAGGRSLESVGALQIFDGYQKVAETYAPLLESVDAKITEIKKAKFTSNKRRKSLEPLQKRLREVVDFAQDSMKAMVDAELMGNENVASQVEFLLRQINALNGRSLEEESLKGARRVSESIAKILGNFVGGDDNKHEYRAGFNRFYKNIMKSVQQSPGSGGRVAIPSLTAQGVRSHIYSCMNITAVTNVSGVFDFQGLRQSVDSKIKVRLGEDPFSGFSEAELMKTKFLYEFVIASCFVTGLYVRRDSSNSADRQALKEIRDIVNNWNGEGNVFSHIADQALDLLLNGEPGLSQGVKEALIGCVNNYYYSSLYFHNGRKLKTFFDIAFGSPAITYSRAIRGNIRQSRSAGVPHYTIGEKMFLGDGFRFAETIHNAVSSEGSDVSLYQAAAFEVAREGGKQGVIFAKGSSVGARCGVDTKIEVASATNAWLDAHRESQGRSRDGRDVAKSGEGLGEDTRRAVGVDVGN